MYRVSDLLVSRRIRPRKLLIPVKHRSSSSIPERIPERIERVFVNDTKVLIDEPGGLTSKPYSFTARPWGKPRKAERTDIVDANINEERLSDTDRFAFDGLQGRRLFHPKVQGVLGEWEKALMLVAQKVSGRRALFQQPGGRQCVTTTGTRSLFTSVVLRSTNDTESKTATRKTERQKAEDIAMYIAETEERLEAKLDSNNAKLDSSKEALNAKLDSNQAKNDKQFENLMESTAKINEEIRKQAMDMFKLSMRTIIWVAGIFVTVTSFFKILPNNILDRFTPNSSERK